MIVSLLSLNEDTQEIVHTQEDRQRSHTTWGDFKFFTNKNLIFSENVHVFQDTIAMLHRLNYEFQLLSCFQITEVDDSL